MLIAYFNSKPWKTHHDSGKTVFLGYEKAWNFVLCAVFYYHMLNARRTLEDAGYQRNSEAPQWKNYIINLKILDAQQLLHSLASLMMSFESDVKAVI